jgi:cytoskeletal protein RodZ
MARSVRPTRSLEFWLLVIATIAGVIGAIGAVAVFAFKTADGRPSEATSTAAATRPDPSPAPSTVSSTADGPTPVVTTGQVARYLAALTPITGQGLFQPKGNDLRLPCPTNQSDDRYREITYSLPARYAQFDTGMTVTGTADPEATAGIEVFIKHRLDRSDRQERVGEPAALAQGASGTVSRPLGDAVQLTLRITCQTRTQAVVLTAPRITRRSDG